MAKKKINVRKDYSYEAKVRLPAYDRAKVRRQLHFLILRGPGLLQAEVIEENAEIKRFATGQHLKIKLLQTQTSEDAAKLIKESYTYASGVVFHPGNLQDEEKHIKNMIAKMRIPVKMISGEAGDSSEYIDALKAMIATEVK